MQIPHDDFANKPGNNYFNVTAYPGYKHVFFRSTEALAKNRSDSDLLALSIRQFRDALDKGRFKNEDLEYIAFEVALPSSEKVLRLGGIIPYKELANLSKTDRELAETYGLEKDLAMFERVVARENPATTEIRMIERHANKDAD